MVLRKTKVFAPFNPSFRNISIVNYASTIFYNTLFKECIKYILLTEA